MTIALITLRTVLERVAISKSEVYRRIKLGTFPAPVRLGPHRIAFVEVEVQAWIQRRLAERNDRIGE